MNELTRLTATHLGELVRSGETSATEVLDAHLAAIDALDHLNAVVARDDAAARAQARRLDDLFLRAGPVGPLHGVPFTVKDWIDAAGLPCAGEGADRTRQPPADATAVARLRAAGAVLVAKTNVGVAHPLFGPCRHPLDPARSPGGSSSGEAALVAAGGSPLGLGSDSGGSIRLPAAWCGVVGMKPTFGRVPATGHYPRIGSLHDGRTVIGPITRSVADAWLGMLVIAGPDGLDAGAAPVELGDPSTVRLAGLRVACETTQLEAAKQHLLALGAIEAGGPPASHHDEAADITRRYWTREQLSGRDNDRLLWDWDRYRRRMLVAAQEFDVLLTPSADGPAPLARPLDEHDYRWTLAWSLTGWPALSLPWGSSAEGLPIALQVVGRRWEDHVVVAVAQALERSLAAGPQE